MTNKHLIAQARDLAETHTTSPWGEQVVWTLRELARALEIAERKIAPRVSETVGGGSQESQP